MEISLVESWFSVTRSLIEASGKNGQMIYLPDLTLLIRKIDELCSDFDPTNYVDGELFIKKIKKVSQGTEGFLSLRWPIFVAIASYIIPVYIVANYIAKFYVLLFWLFSGGCYSCFRQKKIWKIKLFQKKSCACGGGERKN